MSFQLAFRSELHASRAEAWNWITSINGISAELWPILSMSTPCGLLNLKDITFEPGRPLFRSQISLFGVLPVDYSYLTLLELREGFGFVEQSPMGSMRLWRHERRIEEAEHGCVVTDILTCDPRFAARLSKWVVRRLFMHRHSVLRRNLGSA